MGLAHRTQPTSFLRIHDRDLTVLASSHGVTREVTATPITTGISGIIGDRVSTFTQLTSRHATHRTHPGIGIRQSQGSTEHRRPFRHRKVLLDVRSRRPVCPRRHSIRIDSVDVPFHDRGEAATLAPCSRIRACDGHTEVEDGEGSG